MIGFFPYPFLIGVFVLALFVFFIRKQFEKSFLFFVFIFGFYLLLVVGATLFPIPFAYRQNGFEGLRLSRINLIPFNFGRLFDVSSFIIMWELLGNILLTVPFGFGINFILTLGPGYILPLSLFSGLLIESSQFLFSLLLGISYRSVDINDVILNFLGSLLGFGLFYLFALVYVFLIRKLKISPKGLSGFLMAVSCRALEMKKPPCTKAAEVNE